MCWVCKLQVCVSKQLVGEMLRSRTCVLVRRGRVRWRLSVYRKWFSHLGLCLLISKTQEQQRLYQHRTRQLQRIAMLFCNSPPPVIYLNMDITDRTVQIPAHYCTTQTDSVCFAATNQTHIHLPAETHTYIHLCAVWHHQKSLVNLRGRSITAGERALLCNDDAYQCLSCKPCYWLSSVQPIVLPTNYRAQKVCSNVSALNSITATINESWQAAQPLYYLFI